MRKVVIVLSVLIIGGLGAVAYSRSLKATDPGFKTVQVSRGEVVEKALAVGAIRPDQEISVKSKISGIVRKTYREVGDYVQAGEPLFEIQPDPTPARTHRGAARGRKRHQRLRPGEAQVRSPGLAQEAGDHVQPGLGHRRRRTCRRRRAASASPARSSRSSRRAGSSPSD